MSLHLEILCINWSQHEVSLNTIKIYVLRFGNLSQIIAIQKSIQFAPLFCSGILNADCDNLFVLEMGTNGLQLQEVGDFGDENCLPPLNLIRSTKLHLSTEPPISCRCCYRAFLFLSTKPYVATFK